MESVEANDVDFGVAEVEEAYGLRPPEPVLDPETLEAIKAAFYDEEVEDFDEDKIEQILSVLHQRPEYGYREAQELIDEGIFYDLDFEPSRGEVEEAQGRELGGPHW